MRPFLPDDGVPAAAEAAIAVRADGVSCTITKKDEAKGSVLKADTFTFDKVFAPSAGQEAVFNEVSEFVQSALDGYHVSMLAYGQSNSGKTHTMQVIHSCVGAEHACSLSACAYGLEARA